MKRRALATVVALAALIVMVGSALAEPASCLREYENACGECKRQGDHCMRNERLSGVNHGCAQQVAACCAKWKSIIHTNNRECFASSSGRG
ncbi:MAG: hypothetical protein GC182_11265 [Rhodopseudomonas sp.]|nr:hypothetical protein [Rhodopseudomonas sp.]